ncbi:MAG: hypothetical protein NTX50_20205 [Candidatus Sumerlaeota bacterium]|nr:hypothetical protein [Candidatus Sumerlaeota bacterium]
MSNLKKHKYTYLVLWYECIGFMLLIALSWADEMLSVPYLLLGGLRPASSWRESVLETAVIMLVAIPMFVLTKRLIARVFYLEEIPRICAWCRRIHYEGEWLLIEHYLDKGFNTKMSHSMCPECFNKAIAEEMGSATAPLGQSTPPRS